MRTVYIYTLAHPITEEVRYVGKTRNPTVRRKNPLNSCRDKGTHKRNWINKLRSDGLLPLFAILDEVPETDWHFWEKFWIIQLRVWGMNLCNHSDGGEGLTFANSTSFKKGSITWNAGTGHSFVCPVCEGSFKAPSSAERITCSRKCDRILRIRNEALTNTFQSGSIPWNKGHSNYKLKGLKQSRPVTQYTHTGELIAKFDGCKEASLGTGAHPEMIRRCCVGKSHTANGFTFKYTEQ